MQHSFAQEVRNIITVA